VVEKSEQLIVRDVNSDTGAYLDFEVPIFYKNKEIGRVYLGLSKKPLEQAANLTMYIMLGLILAVFVTVVLAVYLLVSRITAPMKILHDALRQTAAGNLAQRISEQRNDELGQMFLEFNKMAQNLEQMKDQWSSTASGNEAGGEGDEPAVKRQVETGPGDTLILSAEGEAQATVVVPPDAQKTVVAPPPDAQKTVVVQPPPDTQKTVIVPPPDTQKTVVMPPMPDAQKTVVVPPPDAQKTVVVPPTPDGSDK